MRTIAQFEIGYTGYLSHELEVTEPLPDFARDPQQLLRGYRAMVAARAFDRKAVSLQRTGRLGTFASCLGEEAVAVAVGLAMHSEDVLVPMYRHHGAHLNRGGRMEELFLYWGGDERGMDFEGPREDLPIAVPIASQAPHAVGVAYKFKYRHEPRVAVCVIGDGGTSKGDFYEALNAAGTWQLPLVFVICNNQWAISVPRSRQSHAETLAQKAVAAGIHGEQVDGNDYIAVRDRMNTALERARQGNGPSVIEALTYRMSDHTTADDARRYRPEEERTAWEARDPIERMRRYLHEIGAWSDDDEQGLDAECRESVDAAAERYLATEAQPAEAMFDYLYAELPRALTAQRNALMDEEDGGDD
ncbi:pyruvate dehydrogenase (acetyl-transferring) E1 component subunit alpha [Arhodomonas sp. AD133]|uniref:pyruvate dehydrogenase (acetyl-transferring) E1 component subunit alpha n=1 Tax=Arhodomonas sp. AD133 TaxID=3415009 RepID=UPI003EB9D19C